MPVAETFQFEDEDGKSLSQVAKLDTMVTVVSALDFLDQIHLAEDLKLAGMELNEDDERTIADLLIEQVEFADVIVLNKIDQVTEELKNRLRASLKALNPRAEILEASHGIIPLEKILNTSKFNLSQAQSSAGWMKTIRGEEVSEKDEFGIVSFVYRARKPFHPERFAKFLEKSPQGVLRAKGYFWLASRIEAVGLFQLAGSSSSFSGIGRWYVTVSEKFWPQDCQERDEIRKNWHPVFGDRKQEIVFIGDSLDEAAIRRELDRALLTDREIKLGSKKWSAFTDPLPAFNIR